MWNQQPLSIHHMLKCCVAASLTTMQTTLQSIQGFSNWMKNAHFGVFQLKIPLSKPPSCCCPCNGTRSTRLEKVAKFRCIHQGGRILRHLHGLLLLPVMQSMITRMANKRTSKRSVAHLGSTGLYCCDMKLFIRSPIPSIKPSSIPPTNADPAMLLGPCLAAMTAPAAAPDMMDKYEQRSVLKLVTTHHPLHSEPASPAPA